MTGRRRPTLLRSRQYAAGRIKKRQRWAQEAPAFPFAPSSSAISPFRISIGGGGPPRISRSTATTSDTPPTTSQLPAKQPPSFPQSPSTTTHFVLGVASQVRFSAPLMLLA